MRVRVLLVVIAVVALLPITAARADDLDPPELTVADVIVTEGNAGAAIISIPVDLSRPTDVIVTVRYTVVPANADTNASDFVAKTGKLTFQVGVTFARVNVKVWGDTSLEGNEGVMVNLSAPVNASLGDGQGEIYIDDDDGTTSASGAVSIGDTVITESDSGIHYAYVPLTLAAPATEIVKIEVLGACSTTAVTAPAKQTITFQIGQRSKALRYRVAADTVPGQAKKAFRKIRVKYGNAVIRSPRGAITIEDNDGNDPVLGESDRINVTSTGEQALWPSPVGCGVYGLTIPKTISQDGRYVVYTSDAMNLVDDDTNGTFDTFIRDRVSHTTERVDVTNDGGELETGAWSGFVSDDGSKVAFTTSSPELAATDPQPPGNGGTFVRDRAAGTTERVGILPDGSTPGFASACGVSGDGRYVGFLASDFSLYVRDLQTETTQLVAAEANHTGFCPFTTDGSQIAFLSSSTTLVPGDTNNHIDVFVANVGTGAVERVNLSPSGQQEAQPDPTRPDFNASRLAMSRDGRYVAFWSTSPNMVPANHSSVFLRDRVAGTTEEVSVGYPTGPDWQICYSAGEGVSNDGRYVSFSVLCEMADGASRPTDLIGEFVRDRATGTTIRVDELADGTPANGFSARTSLLSADGRYVAYASYASNLVPNDTNQFPDAFIRRVS